jgi:hypothetical protein
MDALAMLLGHDAAARANNNGPVDYGAVASTSTAGVVVIKKDAELDQRNKQQKASIANEIANISKNLIGGGVLSLPAGLALYSSHGHRGLVTAAILPDMILTTFVAALLA